MIRRLLDHRGDVVSEFHYDEMEDRSFIKAVQDCEPIIEDNKRRQLDFIRRPGEWQRPIASIPVVIVEQWMREDGINWMSLPKHEKTKYLRRKLNDPQWRHLRTSPGMM